MVFCLFPISAMVAQPAERSCAESVQPFLASILEELMGPVSSGFSEVRSLFEKEVDELSQKFQTTKDSAQLKEVRYGVAECEWFVWGCLPLGLYLHSCILSFPFFLPSPPSFYPLPLSLSFYPFIICFFHSASHHIHLSIHLISFINSFQVAKLIICLCK